MSYEIRLTQYSAATLIDMSHVLAKYVSSGNFKGNNGRGGHSSGRGKCRNGDRFGSRFVCQLCGKAGYIVFSCYKRFDYAFQGLSMQNMQS